MDDLGGRPMNLAGDLCRGQRCPSGPSATGLFRVGVPTLPYGRAGMVGVATLVATKESGLGCDFLRIGIGIPW